MKVKEGRKKREKDPQVQSLLKALSATRALHPAKMTRAMPEGKKGGRGRSDIMSEMNIKKKKKQGSYGTYTPPPQLESETVQTSAQHSMIT